MTTTNQYDQHYQAIGRMLVFFQSLEATLKNGLVLLINNQLGTPSGQLAYATITELSFGTATRLAGGLPTIYTVERIGASSEESAKRLKEELDDAGIQLKKGITLASEVEQRRNQLVHSHWFISSGYIPETGKMTRMKAKTKSGSVKIDFVAESLSDINANSEKAKQAQELIGNALNLYLQIVQYPW